MNPRVFPIQNLFENLFDKIKGIKYGRESSISIELNSSSSKSKIEALISRLDHRMTLSFYDAFYRLRPEDKPLPHGDTGAFTDIISKKGRFLVKRGNHGWSDSQWKYLSKNELIEAIYSSRDFNHGSIKIQSRLIRTQWLKSKDSKVLVAYYHDISDIENLGQQSG